MLRPNPHNLIDLSDYRDLYVVGDIHGEYDRLMALLDLHGFDFNQDVLLSVGDLVDRGPRSFKALKLIYEPWFFCVLGNHEMMMHDALVHGHQEQVWYNNGGEWFEYLNEKEKDEARQAARDVINQCPLALTVRHGETEFGLIHAEPPIEYIDGQLRPDWNIVREGRTQAMMALWSRLEIRARMMSEEPDPEPIANVAEMFCGHTPTKYPIHSANIHWIDTGAVFRGDGGYYTLARIQINSPTKDDYSIHYIKEEV